MKKKKIQKMNLDKIMKKSKKNQRWKNSLI